MLTMNIYPGARKGTRFIFEEKGSEAPNITPADIIVTIDQEPHAVYRREGDDLIISETISLWEVFTCSCTLDLTTLDGRKLAVPINCVSFPPFREKIIPREGMPSTKDPSVRGALRIKLNLKMFWAHTIQQHISESRSQNSESFINSVLDVKCSTDSNDAMKHYFNRMRSNKKQNLNWTNIVIRLVQYWYHPIQSNPISEFVHTLDPEQWMKGSVYHCIALLLAFQVSTSLISINLWKIDTGILRWNRVDTKLFIFFAVLSFPFDW